MTLSSLSSRRAFLFALLLLLARRDAARAFITQQNRLLSLLSKPEESSVALHGVRLNIWKRRRIAFSGSRVSSYSAATSEAATSLETDHYETPLVYRTPQRNDETPSRLQQEFRAMMSDFMGYTKADIALIPNERLRRLYEGVAAGGKEPAVNKAFEVLFEDYVPIRIAGRMIYGKLKTMMDNERKKRKEDYDAVASGTELSTGEIESSRQAFLAIADNKSDGRAYLTVQQLVDTGIAVTAVELLGYINFDDFLDKLDHDKTGRLTFEKLMIGLQRCAKDSTALECTIGGVLPEIVKRMEPRKQESAKSRDVRNRKHNDRYDIMVQSFAEWEDLIPSGDGRRLDVLRGCFAGARNARVVEALRIVYTDYSALRVAGDLIFKIMTQIVKGSRRKA